MKKSFDSVLDECVELVRKGEADIATCLARYPEYSEDLRGYLETALALQDGGVPEPSHQAMDQGRERLLQAVAERQPLQSRSPGFLGRIFGTPALKWAGAMAGLAALLLVGGGVALASGGSLPGEALYPVKRGMEDVRLALTPSDAGKAGRHIALAENRAVELAMVASHASPERIEALSLDLSHNLSEAQRLGGSLTNGKEAAQVQARLEQSARINLALLEGSLVNVPDESRAAFNDAFQLSSQGYAQAVETVALRAPAPLLASMGFLQLRASDPPAPPLDNVFVEVDKIEAYLAAGSESKWVTIVDSPTAFDLLRVEQIHKFLGQQEILAGTYTQIRFEIGQAVVVAEGEAYIAKVPSGKLTFGRPFTVREGQITVVTIDFDGQRSVHLNGEGDYMLVPDVKLLVDEPLSDGDESSLRHDHASGKRLEIEGTIESFSTTTATTGSEAQWVVVGGQTIKITPETEVKGTLAVGRYLYVEVVIEADGSFTAAELKVKKGKKGRESGLPKVELEGTIEAINGNTWTVAGYTVHLSGEATWQIGGETVTVTTNAEIDGDPQVGYTAEVEGLLGPDGILLALEIDVEDDGKEDGHREEYAHFELNDVIESLSGTQGAITSLSEEDLEGQDWPGDVTVTLVDGTTFIINVHTDFKGVLQQGVEVDVEIETAADGTLLALEIDVEDDGKEDGHREEGAEEPAATADDNSASSNQGEEEQQADENCGNEIRQEIRFTVTATGGQASGHAEFEFREGDGTRFSVEVEDVGTDGTYTVKVTPAGGGAPILEKDFDVVDGMGDLNLDSRDGDDLTNVVKDGLVEVFAPNGALIFSGMNN